MESDQQQQKEARLSVEVERDGKHIRASTSEQPYQVISKLECLGASCPFRLEFSLGLLVIFGCINAMLVSVSSEMQLPSSRLTCS